jgi:hypothetical protein
VATIPPLALTASAGFWAGSIWTTQDWIKTKIAVVKIFIWILLNQSNVFASGIGGWRDGLERWP